MYSRSYTQKKILKPPAIMASGTSTTYLPSDPIEPCDRVNLLLQEKRAGRISKKINDEIVSIVDKLLEYKCISTEQHKQFLYKGNFLHKKKKYVQILIWLVYKDKYNYSHECM